MLSSRYTRRPVNNHFLVAITPVNNQSLYRSFRDYFIFLSLIRELSQTTDCKLFGFSWLPNQSLHLGQFDESYFIDQWIAIMKRYCYWLQLVNEPEHQFIIRLIKLDEMQQSLDALKYLHLQVLNTNNITDPLAYHWHSLPIYHQYWDMPWLATDDILLAYSKNELLAKDAFRQHMITPQTIDFAQQLKENNIVLQHVSDQSAPTLPTPIGVQETTSDYHKNFLTRSYITLDIRHSDLLVTVKHHGKLT